MATEYQSKVPGQQALPGMADRMGYGTITLDKPWQEAFCWSYVLRGNNGTRAMMEIRPHLTEASAAVQASRLLRNDNIVNRIAEVRKEQRAILESKVLGQHDQILEYDPLDFFDVNETLNTVELKPIHKLPEWLRKLCTLDTKIVDKELKTVVVAPDKDKSRFELAKILGMITSKGEIEHKGDAVTALLAALDGGSKQIVATGATDATAE